MKQDNVAGKILAELIEAGIISEKHEWTVYNYLQQAYAAGHDIGRKLRSYHRAVAQFDSNGDLINVFDSVADAVRATGFNKSNIANCARGRKGCDTVGGFRWQYADLMKPTSFEKLLTESEKSKSDPQK
jgi:hypothetical protein